MRVMIVSADAGVRGRTGAALEARDDVDVITATSADDAHRTLRAEDVDVVVMDGDMRPEGGYSVIYEMRAAAELTGEPAPPVIVLMDREQDRWLAHWAGADEALMKPVNPFDLAEVVRRLSVRDAGGTVPDDPGETSGRGLEMDEPPELDHVAP